jgi:hypothetical protein
MHEPISTLVYAGSQSNVDTVVVDGRIVLEGGRFPHVDEAALVREVQERALSLSRRVGTYRLTEGRRFTPFRYDASPRLRERQAPRALHEDGAAAAEQETAAGLDGAGADVTAAR